MTKQTSVLSKLNKELCDMLTFCRPAFSGTEEKFISKYIDSLPNMCSDAYGNRYVQIGDNDHNIMFSCHTDTVHRIEGIQRVLIDSNFKVAYSEDANCLGADDTTGCFIMRNMILAGVPGLYIFHRAEEIGGRGSRWITLNNKELVEGIKHALAFDRKGYTHIITHQGGRSCSDAFAKDLAARLGMGFKPDSTGTFTDTANYTDIISECTNLSVGYWAQHTHNEVQDIAFAERLLQLLIGLDWSDLTEERKPGEVEYRSYGGYRGGFYDDDDWNYWMGGAGRQSSSRFPHGQHDRTFPDNPNSAGAVRTNNSRSAESVRGGKNGSGAQGSDPKHGSVDLATSFEALLEKGIHCDDFEIDTWEEAYELINDNPVAAADLLLLAYHSYMSPNNKEASNESKKIDQSDSGKKK